MVLVITKNQVSDRKSYLNAAAAFVRDARCEAGCLGMQMVYRDEEPDMVAFVSKWEQKSDWEAHCQGSTFARHVPAMGPYYMGGTDSFYEVAE